MHNRRLGIALVALVIALGLISFLLLRYWYQPTYSFVYTDNSRIDGVVVRVVAENHGQVVKLPFDTGDAVEKLQPIAILKVLASGGNPSDSRNQRFLYQNILSPISGTVVSRSVNPGDTVLAGQPLVTIADLDNIWVIANIDENDINRVEPGQRVDIHVDATNEVFQGWVEYVIPSTTSIVLRPFDTSLVVAANTQDVPVKIRFEQKSGYVLYPGLSTEVKIYTK